MPEPTVDFAIVHYPVLNRVGEVIAAQIDEFDFFDACRLSLAYPIRRMWVVNPTPSQRDLAQRLIRHGTDPQRQVEGREVFDRTVWVPDLETAVSEASKLGPTPRLVVTSAKPGRDDETFGQMRASIATGSPHMVLFGKAWGLADDVFDRADVRLEPVSAGTGYDHLSVRSAMSIVLDRLLAPGDA